MHINFKTVLANLAKKTYNEVAGDGNFIVSNTLVSCNPKLTKNVNACLAAAVVDSSRQANTKGYSLLAHIAPEQYDTVSLRNVLGKKLFELEKKSGTTQLDGLICGGWHSRTGTYSGDRSVELMTEIDKIFQDFGINTSLICGKNPHHLDDIYVNNARVSIVNTLWEKLGLTPEKLKKMSTNDVANILEEHYETVDIHPNHIFTMT